MCRLSIMIFLILYFMIIQMKIASLFIVYIHGSPWSKEHRRTLYKARGMAEYSITGQITASCYMNTIRCKSSSRLHNLQVNQTQPFPDSLRVKGPNPETSAGKLNPRRLTKQLCPLLQFSTEFSNLIPSSLFRQRDYSHAEQKRNPASRTKVLVRILMYWRAL